MPQTLPIAYNGQEIGQGYNSQTRENLGTALTMTDVSEDPSASGQEVTTLFTSVNSQESLMQSLGISSSLDVRYGLFSGGAKFDFAQSHAVNSFSSMIAGRSQVLNAIRHGHGFKPTDTAAQLSAAGRMDDFRAAFGDMFVRSMKTGGELNIVARITSVSEEHQTKLAAALHAEYNGLAASGTFKAALDLANKETDSRTEVTVFVHQAGGIGGEQSFTGPDAVKISQRLSDFPSFVHDHPVGYEVEVATYNTIPLLGPTAEEAADLQLVLQDCFNQKMGFLKALSDLDFALSEDASKYFDNLPSPAELTQRQVQYRSALNALMAHAIALSTGKITPPQEFIANPPPPPLTFRKKPFAPPPPPPPSLVTIPDWGNVESMDRGGDVPSADDLGLVIQEVDDQPVLDPHERDRGDIVSMSPPAGTVVPRGTVVTVHVRNR